MKQHVQLPGATMISCFFDLIRRKVRSFWGSMSRTVLLAFMVSWWSRPAYWTVVELSRVVRIGMPVMRCNLELRSSGLSGRCTHCKIYWRSLILTDGEKLMGGSITGWHQFQLPVCLTTSLSPFRVLNRDESRAVYKFDCGFLSIEVRTHELPLLVMPLPLLFISAGFYFMDML